MNIIILYEDKNKINYFFDCRHKALPWVLCRIEIWASPWADSGELGWALECDDVEGNLLGTVHCGAVVHKDTNKLIDTPVDEVKNNGQKVSKMSLNIAI